MKIRLFIVASALFMVATVPSIAQEKVVLSAPQVAPSVSEYSIRYFAIDVENQRIVLELKSNTGTLKQVVYENSAPVMGTNEQGQSIVVTPSDNKATNMIVALNKANLTIKSLERRIFEQLIADGHLSGSLTGTPK